MFSNTIRACSSIRCQRHRLVHPPRFIPHRLNSSSGAGTEDLEASLSLAFQRLRQQLDADEKKARQVGMPSPSKPQTNPRRQSDVAAPVSPKTLPKIPVPEYPRDSMSAWVSAVMNNQPYLSNLDHLRNAGKAIARIKAGPFNLAITTGAHAEEKANPRHGLECYLTTAESYLDGLRRGTEEPTNIPAFGASLCTLALSIATITFRLQFLESQGAMGTDTSLSSLCHDIVHLCGQLVTSGSLPKDAKGQALVAAPLTETSELHLLQLLAAYGRMEHTDPSAMALLIAEFHRRIAKPEASTIFSEERCSNALIALPQIRYFDSEFVRFLQKKWGLKRPTSLSLEEICKTIGAFQSLGVLEDGVPSLLTLLSAFHDELILSGRRTGDIDAISFEVNEETLEKYNNIAPREGTNRRLMHSLCKLRQLVHPFEGVCTDAIAARARVQQSALPFYKDYLLRPTAESRRLFDVITQLCHVAVQSSLEEITKKRVPTTAMYRGLYQSALLADYVPDPRNLSAASAEVWAEAKKVHDESFTIHLKSSLAGPATDMVNALGLYGNHDDDFNRNAPQPPVPCELAIVWRGVNVVIEPLARSQWFVEPEDRVLAHKAAKFLFLQSQGWVVIPLSPSDVQEGVELRERVEHLRQLLDKAVGHSAL